MMVSMMKFYENADFLNGNRIFYKLFWLMQALFWETNPIGVKTVSKLMGISSGSLRLPLVKMDIEKEKKIKEILTKIGDDCD